MCKPCEILITRMSKPFNKSFYTVWTGGSELLPFKCNGTNDVCNVFIFYVLCLKIIERLLLTRCLELYCLYKALMYTVINQFLATMVTSVGRILASQIFWKWRCIYQSFYMSGGPPGLSPSHLVEISHAFSY